VSTLRYAVGQRSETVRRANLSSIARELHLRGSLSRSELVARSGLTRSAIRGLIGEFVAAGLVAEERSDPLGIPGRPSALVEPDPESALVLSLAIAVDSLSAALVGFGGTVLDIVRVDRQPGRPSVDEIVGDLRVLISRLDGWPAVHARTIGVGVAVVGVVRRADGLVSMAPNLGWRDVPLGDALARAIGVDVPITVANEADLGALAELRRGVATGGDHIVYISGEVGVGGGLIVDGKPLTGVAGYGGEVGHMPVNPDGLACRCGSTGCRETEIGEGTLLRLAGHPPDGGREAVDAVLAEADAGSPAAIAALEHVARWLGIGLAGLVNVLNPRLVVLGGRFERIHPYVVATVERELDRRALAAPRGLVRIVPSALGGDAPLLGAAELAFEPFLADPAAWLRARRESAGRASA
jgi:predicted NBD/HSP70 family sugar kinase